jgi:hypothetical protein
METLDIASHTSHLGPVPAALFVTAAMAVGLPPLVSPNPPESRP